MNAAALLLLTLAAEGGDAPVTGAGAARDTSARAARDEARVIVEAPAAGECVPGTVTLSDGKELSGRLWLTPGKLMEICDLDAKEWKELKLSEIRTMRSEVRSEKMEEKWRWKEHGSDEKVRSGKSYPRRWLDHVVRLRDGSSFRGRLKGTVLYVGPAGDTEKKKTKLFLRQYDRGKEGQSLEQLVYVTGIVIGENEENAARSGGSEGHGGEEEEEP